MNIHAVFEIEMPTEWVNKLQRLSKRLGKTIPETMEYCLLSKCDELLNETDIEFTDRTTERASQKAIFNKISENRIL